MFEDVWDRIVNPLDLGDLLHGLEILSKVAVPPDKLQTVNMFLIERAGQEADIAIAAEFFRTFKGVEFKACSFPFRNKVEGGTSFRYDLKCDNELSKKAEKLIALASKNALEIVTSKAGEQCIAAAFFITHYAADFDAVSPLLGHEDEYVRLFAGLRLLQSEKYVIEARDGLVDLLLTTSQEYIVNYIGDQFVSCMTDEFDRQMGFHSPKTRLTSVHIREPEVVAALCSTIGKWQNAYWKHFVITLALAGVKLVDAQCLRRIEVSGN